MIYSTYNQQQFNQGQYQTQTPQQMQRIYQMNAQYNNSQMMAHKRQYSLQFQTNQPQTQPKKKQKLTKFLKLSNRERGMFSALYTSIDSTCPKQLDGKKCAAFMKKSGLSKEVLKKIWLMCSSDLKNLGRDEFYLALKLIAYAQNKIEVCPDSIRRNIESPLPNFSQQKEAKKEEVENPPSPLQKKPFENINANKQGDYSNIDCYTVQKQAPPKPQPIQPVQQNNLTNNMPQNMNQLTTHTHNPNVNIPIPHNASQIMQSNIQTQKTYKDAWNLSEYQISKYTQYFTNLDKNNTGKITNTVGKALLLRSKLPKEVLKQIWTLSDIGNKGFLTKNEFIVAIHLLSCAKQNIIQIPETLPNVLKEFISQQQLDFQQVLRQLPQHHRIQAEQINNQNENQTSHSHFQPQIQKANDIFQEPPQQDLKPVIVVQKVETLSLEKPALKKDKSSKNFQYLTKSLTKNPDLNKQETIQIQPFQPQHSLQIQTQNQNVEQIMRNNKLFLDQLYIQFGKGLQKIQEQNENLQNEVQQIEYKKQRVKNEIMQIKNELDKELIKTQRLQSAYRQEMEDYNEEIQKISQNPASILVAAKKMSETELMKISTLTDFNDQAFQLQASQQNLQQSAHRKRSQEQENKKQLALNLSAVKKQIVIKKPTSGRYQFLKSEKLTDKTQDAQIQQEAQNVHSHNDQISNTQNEQLMDTNDFNDFNDEFEGFEVQKEDIDQQQLEVQTQHQKTDTGFAFNNIGDIQSEFKNIQSELESPDHKPRHNHQQKTKPVTGFNDQYGGEWVDFGNAY